MASSTTYSSAKELLDKIGQQVHEIVKKDVGAEAYKNKLKGDLKKATSSYSETGDTTDTCNLVEQYYNHANGGDNIKRYPCTELSGIYVERFSNTLGGQCTDSKMRGGGIGACAPYRRLHLCHHNLESIDTKSMTTTSDTLLAEVCMAAKYEGQSIKTPYTIHQQTNKDTASQLCTVLARSFADIGDIVRGKDLFLGNTYESAQRKQLDKKLKTIFNKIHKEVTNGNKDAKDRYKKDKDPNFFQLREDWWDANRHTVWEAITCKAEQNNKYFRKTACAGKTPNQGRCRCDDKPNIDPPTYFDYVPQYLRWFDEWAEDFCRKRKHKLENAKEQCRGENNDKYCSRNGYNCKETIRGKNILVSDPECTNCSVLCTPFVDWIDNKKLEFEKQKRKYDEEIKKYKNGASSGRRTKETSNNPINNLYVKDFYQQLQSDYGDVKKFLGLLNQETTCKGHPEVEVKGEKADHVDFTKEDVGEIFSHTEYCETCPWCAKKVKEGGKWTDEEHKDGCPPDGITTHDNKKTTEIKLLDKDTSGTNIVDKLGGLCGSNANNEQYDIWKCYYDKNKEENSGGGDKDYCILQDGNQDKRDRRIMPYDVLFPNWINEMLKDSVEWSKELDRCINNKETNNCIRECKSKCECFEKWVERMKKEWKQLEEHYVKEDFGDWGPYGTLEGNLQNSYLEMIQKDYPEEKPVQKMEEIIKKNKPNMLSVKEHDNSITKFLQHEQKEAQKCVSNNPPEKCQPKKFKNPCSGDKTGDQRYPVLAGKMAYQMHETAKQKMIENSVDGEGESKLKGDINKATFKNGVKGSDLNGKICNIDKNHSNATGSSNDPCHGKDGGQDGDRMKIGTPWKPRSQIQMSAEDIYMPPRREHMCTSNLEKLHVGDVTNNGNVNDTFLGNVLLAAKCEANNIIETYKKKNSLDDQKELTNLNDQATVCRAIRRSFADLGDIIRGRDLWENGDEQRTQGRLKTVFGIIKKNMPGIQGNEKYNGDDESKKPAYKQLREDWWEANRSQVWDAMKCHIKELKDKSGPQSSPSDHCGYSHGTPLEDYIPQRLRWMTEWAEWYCKKQSQEYDELETQCGGCMSKNKGKGGKGCTSGDGEICTKCDKQCKEYGEKIKKWAEQWNTMEIKYLTLYLQATKDSTRMAFFDADYQLMVDFFEELQKEIKNSALNRPKRSTDGTNTDPTLTSPYSSAAGYIHQEIGNAGCQIQKHFCTSGKEDKDYVFRDKPNDHEKECNCDKKTASSPEELGRSDTVPSPSSPSDDKNDDSSEDDDEFEEDEDEDEEEDEDTEESEEKKEEDKTQAEDTTPSVEVCSIVDEALKDDLSEACTLKYVTGKNYGWKCVTPSGDKADTDDSTTREGSDATGESSPTRSKRDLATSSGTNQGGLCIPPRRRKLYVTPLTKWAETVGDKGESKSPQTSGTSSQSEKLRTAFIESAAVETFFLWDRYKKEKKPQAAQLQLPGVTADPDDPEQNQLKSGTIPPDFLRLMFYTLGDYRDICIGKTPDGIDKVSASGDNKSGNNIKEISSKIEEILKNGDNNKPSGVQNGGKDPVQTTKPEDWWETNTKYIWEGMICALTYKDSGTKGGKPEKDEQVYNKFFGTQNGSPGSPVTNTGTYQEKYQYTNVKLKDEPSETQPKASTEDPINNPKLTQFVEIPTYFRYLHEWGSDFCGKRARMLKNVKHNCRNSDNPGHAYCSGDGHDCTENGNLGHKDIFAEPNCPSCYEQCRKYRKWIDIKFEEFRKQENTYNGELDKLNGNSENKDYQKLKDYTSVDKFLSSLKHCKNNQNSENKENELNFSKPLETFNPSTYCETCPPNEVKCNGARRGKSGECTPDNGNKWQSVFNSINGKVVKSTINVDMIDRRGPFIEKYLEKSKELNASFKKSYLFKGVRTQEWKCRFNKEEKTDVCHLINFNKDIDLNDYTTFKVLLIYWLEDFIEGYYILKKRKVFEQCKENGGNTCNGQPKNDCACAKVWIDKKKNEWGDIKNLLNEQYKGDNAKMDLWVRSSLVDLIKAFAPKIDKGRHKGSVSLVKLFECFCNNISENSGGNDPVKCLLEKLEDKIGECKKNHAQTGAQSCTQTTPPETPDDDEEEEYENEDENEKKVEQPGFCPKPKETKEKEEEKCEPESTATPEEPAAAGGKETNPETPQPQPAPVPEKKDEKSPKPVGPTPQYTLSDWRDVMSASAFPWTVGVAFVALSYWWFKVYLYVWIYVIILKKKRKKKKLKGKSNIGKYLIIKKKKEKKKKVI